jgi:hypothetical protein
MIYPRDEEGKCINPEDEVRWQRTLEEMRKSQVPDWQDPVLLRQIKVRIRRLEETQYFPFKCWVNTRTLESKIEHPA